MPYARIFYHFVWATKGRLPLITDANRKVIFAAIAAKIAELGGSICAINAMPDHMHLVATLPPTLAPALVVGQVKGISSRAAGRLEVDDSVFAWQSEYGVLTVSEAHLGVVVRYVQEQQQRHAADKLNDRLEHYGET